MSKSIETHRIIKDEFTYSLSKCILLWSQLGIHTDISLGYFLHVVLSRKLFLSHALGDCSSILNVAIPVCYNCACNKCHHTCYSIDKLNDAKSFVLGKMLQINMQGD